MSERELPIYEVEPEICSALTQAEPVRLVLEAPTGSGKSTQLPQMMIDRGLVPQGEIVVLQPRRFDCCRQRTAQRRPDRVARPAAVRFWPPGGRGGPA